MANEEADNQPSATLELSDANLSLWRGCTFSVGAQQHCTGDRMIIKDKRTGSEEDVVMIGAGTHETVKRLVLHIEFTTGRSGYSFADVDADNEKRLLAIYKMFDAK